MENSIDRIYAPVPTLNASHGPEEATNVQLTIRLKWHLHDSNINIYKIKYIPFLHNSIRSFLSSLDTRGNRVIRSLTPRSSLLFITYDFPIHFPLSIKPPPKKKEKNSVSAKLPDSHGLTPIIGTFASKI